MDKLRDNIILAVILTASSAVIYLIQNAIFHNPSDTMFYLFQDLAFVPVQALIVTLILNRFLNLAEKRKQIKKMNVIISTFFADTGISIMTAMSRFNRSNDEISGLIKVDEFASYNKSSVSKMLDGFKYDFYADPERLDELAVIMDGNKGFFIDLLENPNLLEHESFTDMMWALFHVADELKTRGDLRKLSQAEIDHISNDMLRAYTAIMMEWAGYIMYLKDEYPFLYASAIRKNPFHAA
jgi:hypothetical protein